MFLHWILHRFVPSDCISSQYCNYAPAVYPLTPLTTCYNNASYKNKVDIIACTWLPPLTSIMHIARHLILFLYYYTVYIKIQKCATTTCNYCITSVRISFLQKPELIF